MRARAPEGTNRPVGAPVAEVGERFSPSPEHMACIDCPQRSRSLFAGLPDDDVLDALRVVTRYTRGAPVYKQGEPARGYLCIRSGRVRITRAMPDGTVHVLGWAEPGDALGVQEMHGQNAHQSSAHAAADSVVCLVPTAASRILARRHPRLLTNVAHRLAVALRHVEDEALKTRRSVRQRVAGLLVELWREAGCPQELTVQRQEMAQRVGTTAETFARLLTDFHEVQWIRRTRRVIRIVDAPALEALAAGGRWRTAGGTQGDG